MNLRHDKATIQLVIEAAYRVHYEQGKHPAWWVVGRSLRMSGIFTRMGA